MTTHPPTNHAGRLGGMNRTLPPHLLAETEWRTKHNLYTRDGKILQVRGKKVGFTATGHSNETLLALASLPAELYNLATVVGLTEKKAVVLREDSSRVLQENGSDVAFTEANVYYRWGTAVHNGCLFFVNPVNKVRYTDGAVVKSLAAAPAGRHVEVFFDHVVVGSPIYRGEELTNGIRWSHLKDYNQWEPNTQSEADSYRLTEHQRADDVFTGVTGMAKLGVDMLCVYTPSCIYAMRYTGLPRVMRTDPIVFDVGCGLPYGLCSVAGAHYFVDVHNETFYSYSQEGLREVGFPIKTYFFNDLSTDRSLQARTWAYADRQLRHIYWVYCSTSSSGAFDKAVGFNYQTGEWFSLDVENVQSYCEGGRRAPTFRYSTGQLSSASQAAYPTTEAFEKLWGSANEQVLQESATASDTIALGAPVLETPDIVGKSIQHVQTVSGIAINATASEVLVEVAARTKLDDTVTWKSVGRWRQGMEEREVLTFTPVSGQILRYRFTLPGSTATVMTYASAGLNDFTIKAELPCT